MSISGAVSGSIGTRVGELETRSIERRAGWPPCGRHHRRLTKAGGSGREHGTSLIEVLVAVLVVSLGVIAMAGAMVASGRLGKASEYRAAASLLTADIADRITANLCAMPGRCANGPPAGAPSSYDQITAFLVPAPAPVPAGAEPPCALATRCTPTEMAAIDLAQWNRAVHDAVPNGMGYVRYDPIGNAIDLWVAWLDPAALSTSDFDRIEGTNNATGRARCPPGFAGAAPQPRCTYLRVAL